MSDTLFSMINSGSLCIHLLFGPWSWVNIGSNSAAVQAIGSALSVMVGIVTIIVLSITWRAINRQAVAAENQAEASRALIGAAEQQTKATVAAATAANEQSRLLALQYEQNLAPLIVARLVLGGPANTITLLELKNVGIGAAFGVVVFTCKVDLGATDMTYPITDFSPSTLGPGETGQANFPASRDGFMTIRYRGADRVERFTIVSNTHGFWQQEHWVRQGLKIVGL